jgi:CIC family chloride channel protein
LTLLLIMTGAKILATSISLGGGFMGGMFAPSLFVGAAFGSAFGQIVGRLLPAALIADPAAYAMAGMAALIAGVIRAPITAVLLLFELTADYRLILPLMLTTVVSLFLVERLAPQSIYQEALARKGIRLSAGREVLLMETIHVRDVLTPQPPLIPVDLPARMLPVRFGELNTHGMIVVDAANQLAGVVTTQDISRAAETGSLETATTGDICTREVVTVTPDDTVAEALRRMGPRDLGRLPVVAVDDPRCVVGLLRRRDVIGAYDRVLQRRQQEQERLRRLIEAG